MKSQPSGTDEKPPDKSVGTAAAGSEAERLKKLLRGICLHPVLNKIFILFNLHRLFKTPPLTRPLRSTQPNLCFLRFHQDINSTVPAHPIPNGRTARRYKMKGNGLNFMGLIPCTSPCIYQKDGLCDLDCAAAAGVPPAGGGCVHFIPVCASRSAGPPQYSAPESAPDLPARGSPESGAPESDIS